MIVLLEQREFVKKSKLKRKAARAAENAIMHLNKANKIITLATSGGNTATQALIDKATSLMNTSAREAGFANLEVLKFASPSTNAAPSTLTVGGLKALATNMSNGNLGSDIRIGGKNSTHGLLSAVVSSYTNDTSGRMSNVTTRSSNGTRTNTSLVRGKISDAKFNLNAIVKKSSGNLSKNVKTAGKAAAGIALAAGAAYGVKKMYNHFKNKKRDID